MEDILGSEDFGTILDEYNSFINDAEDSIAKGDPNEEVYKEPPDSPGIYEILHNSDK